MLDLAITLLVFVVPVVIILIVFRAVANRGKREQPLMDEIAANLGLEKKGGEPYLPSVSWLSFIRKPVHLEGTRAGRHFLIRQYTTGSGKNQTTYTECVAHTSNPTGLTLTIGRESIFTRIGKSLGMKDIRTGDDAFDKRFHLKSNRAEGATLILFPEIRQRLLDWQSEFLANGTIEATERRIRYYETGHLSNEQTARRMEHIAPILGDLADIFDVLEGVALP